jgi:hypothetical protein
MILADVVEYILKKFKIEKWFVIGNTAKFYYSFPHGLTVKVEDHNALVHHEKMDCHFISCSDLNELDAVASNVLMKLPSDTQLSLF